MAHPVVLQLIVPSMEQLSKIAKWLFLQEHIECVSRATKRHKNY